MNPIPLKKQGDPPQGSNALLADQESVQFLMPSLSRSGVGLESVEPHFGV